MKRKAEEITPGQKALSLSYVHAQLLITNLETTVHELKVINNPKYKQLEDKLVKLKSATKNAFKGINKNLEETEDYQKVGELIENLMNEAWDSNP